MRSSVAWALSVWPSGRRVRRRARGGVSLLEVLIAIGVLSIGLLGVAAIIPVARFQMVEAAKADRASACGQAVLHDFKVRGMDNRNQWWNHTPYIPPPFHNEKRPGESYAYDSAFFRQNGKDDNWYDFPYNVWDPDPWTGDNWRRMKRLWFIVPGCISPGDPSQPLLAAIHQWDDDLLFSLPADETERPEQIFDDNGLKPEFQGNYSWLATVTPLVERYEYKTFTFPDGHSESHWVSEQRPVYEVSVAVFYNRDTTKPGDYLPGETPGERQVQMDAALPPGLGGGDVRLVGLIDIPGQPQPKELDPEYLDVKENEWLLVSGAYWDSKISPSPPAGTGDWIGVHKWYRIVATGEITFDDANGNGQRDANAGEPWYREVTLAGPDWNQSWGPKDWDLDGDGNPDVTIVPYATLLKGVVGVFTTRMQFDG